MSWFLYSLERFDENGNRKIGKSYFEEDSQRNIVELRHIPQVNSKLTELEQLIADYKKDMKYIKGQKRHWLPPVEKNLTLKERNNGRNGRRPEEPGTEGCTVYKTKESAKASRERASKFWASWGGRTVQQEEKL